ncbi:MAG: hypothetical protein HOE90_01255 [Bacteriovoracaceae bacterium]|jgi:hypothetical protein|nr:hypothetical protein [Bacteriovoracaceae bacterium]
MKGLGIAFTLLLMTQGFAFAGTPVELDIPATEVYLINGFDDNDNVEVILSGNLPNLCHQSPTTYMDVVGTTVKVRMTALHYHESNPFCPKVEVPFLETVSLGLLAEGSYDVVVSEGKAYELNGDLNVGEAKNDRMDDHIYAKVEYIEKNEKRDEISLVGVNPSNCFELDEIKWVSNKKNAFAVLPILKQVSKECKSSQVPFRYTVKLPNKLKKQKTVLIHVRSMEGKSVNTLFTRM